MAKYLATRGFNYKFHMESGVGGPTYASFPVSANTGRIGDLVILTTGQLALASGSIADVVGICLEDWTGATAGDLKKIALIRPGQVWEVKANGSCAGINKGTRTIDIVTATPYQLDTADIVNGSMALYGVDPDDNTLALVTFTKWTL